jgi:squalene-hopene/tetraprenyl-beta-curcumene cyclase
MPMFPDNAPELLAAAAIVEQLQARWPLEIALLNSRSSKYYALPYLLIEAFPALRLDDVQPLVVFSRLLAGSILLHDELVDRAETPRAVTSLRVMAMQAEAYRVAHALFPPAARFWDRLREDLAEYASACLEEQRFVAGGRPLGDYTEALALRIAMGKTRLARSVVAGLVELAQDDAPFVSLGQILDEMHKAMQLLDDLQDWKEDHRRGTPSLVLSRIGAPRTGSGDEAEQRCTTTRLARELYYGGHAAYVLDLALAALAAADAHRAAFPGLAVFGLVDALRRRCQLLRIDIDRIVGDNLRRARGRVPLELPPPASSDAWHKMAWSALDFLAGQWRLGFGEARDIIQFPRRLGFGPGEACYFGDVFQRALIADALCDAEAALGCSLRPVLDNEVQHILEQRIESSTGGWRYYSNLPELPPDADSLAQVMRVLVRTGRRNAVIEHCEAPLRVLLEQDRHPDGSFETWIVPTTARTLLEERHAELVRTGWQGGADCDVMANLIVALRLYDPVRFADVIRTAAHYVIAQQNSDGTWATRWYFGPSYGMYICLRALEDDRVGAGTVQRTAEFLRRCQHEDGGWGTEAPSDALATALALLGLAAAQKMAGDRSDRQRAERALEFLLGNQEAGRAWPALKLINVGKGTYYGSRTVTTAFVLKAALAWATADSSPLRRDGEPHG